MKAHGHELVLSLVLIGMIVVIGTINPAFFSIGNIFDLMKSSVVIGLLAIGVLLVLVSGGIDISFTAVAAFAMYVTCRILVATDSSGTILVALVLAGSLGAGLGLVNAVFISWFRLPTLIVTLGTASLFRGFLLAFVGTTIINNLPPGMIRFSRWTILDQRLASGETIGLSVSFFLLVLVAVTAWFFLRYTLAGRGIYAMGGNLEAAERVGFNLTGLRCLIYAVVGCLAGMAGILHASMMRNANPFDLVGTELTVIAAVVLGGASITGGSGSVLGTLLGVGLMVTINNSLILLQIPSYWQRVAVGLILIVSTGVAASKRAARQRGVVVG